MKHTTASIRQRGTPHGRTRGFYRLAAIDMMRCDFERALEHINRSLVRNAHNMKARGAKVGDTAQAGLH